MLFNPRAGGDTPLKPVHHSGAAKTRFTRTPTAAAEDPTPNAQHASIHLPPETSNGQWSYHLLSSYRLPMKANSTIPPRPVPRTSPDSGLARRGGGKFFKSGHKKYTVGIYKGHDRDIKRTRSGHKKDTVGASSVLEKINYFTYLCT